jgi:hypothetical protein
MQGCLTASIDEPESLFASSSMSQMIAIAPSLLKLTVYSKNINREGLDEISAYYDIDVTTPTIRLFETARDALLAYRAVAAKMTVTRHLTQEDEMFQRAVLPSPQDSF